MGKRASTSLSLSYPKKDWETEPRQSFFLYNTDQRIQSVNAAQRKFVVIVTLKEELVGPCPPFPFCDNDLKVPFPMMQSNMS